MGDSDELRGSSCPVLYNNTPSPDSRNLAMLLKCGGAFGCQDTHIRSHCYARVSFEGEGQRLDYPGMVDHIHSPRFGRLKQVAT